MHYYTVTGSYWHLAVFVIHVIALSIHDVALVDWLSKKEEVLWVM